MNKRTLTDCAVDRILPWKNMVTPYQAMMEAVKWLERMIRGEISYINRRDLNVSLIPVDINNELLFSESNQLNEQQRLVSLSKFSRLNNLFNNSKSETIHKKIQDNPRFLKKYHDTLDEVKKQWPIDPVEVIGNKINELKLPAHIIMKLVIGDFGCGRAKLAELLKENRTYSFDHHNILNDKIIACDMKSVPLKRDGQLDIAVFCLSLMEENWPDYIIEAKRCLTKNGLFFIAETTKSLRGRLHNLRKILEEQGFKKYSDEEKGDITFIEARRS